MKCIAERAYDVGFGAKRHFATFDIIEKVPGLIGFSSIAFGILALVFNDLSTQLASATFIILGVMNLYINFYSHNKLAYEETGKSLTELYNKLKSLYFDTKDAKTADQVADFHTELQEIEKKYIPLSISKQIAFSNWFAHYKFFWESQIGWIDDQIQFKFWRDKIPLSLTLMLVAGTALISFLVFKYFPN